eukprot:g15716.t1
MQMDREQPLDLANTSGAPNDFLDEVVVPPVASHSLRVAVALVYSLVCILGLLGNLLVLQLVGSISRHSQGAIDCLVFSLALADFHFVLALPFWAAELALDYSWPFGHTMCKLVLFITMLNVYALLPDRYEHQPLLRRPSGRGGLPAGRGPSSGSALPSGWQRVPQPPPSHLLADHPSGRGRALHPEVPHRRTLARGLQDPEGCHDL